MARLVFSRTYRPIDGKDPMIFKIKTMIKDEGLMGNLDLVAEIANIHPSTLIGWFDGDTISPIQRTTGSVISGLGYELEIVKKREIDVQHEAKRAADWLLKQNSASKKKVESARKRANGRHT